MTTDPLLTANPEATAPERITLPEWMEIVQCQDVREAWGLEDDCTPEEFEGMVYGVKFKFVSGSPGYVGDLYILQGDSLEPPMRLLRQHGGLVPSF
jgi:hypothetical protein